MGKKFSVMLRIEQVLEKFYDLFFGVFCFSTLSVGYLVLTEKIRWGSTFILSSQEVEVDGYTKLAIILILAAFLTPKEKKRNDCMSVVISIIEFSICNAFLIEVTLLLLVESIGGL